MSSLSQPLTDCCTVNSCLAVRPLILRTGFCEDSNESSGFMNAVNFSTSRKTIRFSRSTPLLGISPVVGPTEHPREPFDNDLFFTLS
jgi:hypothetical protein